MRFQTIVYRLQLRLAVAAIAVLGLQLAGRTADAQRLTTPYTFSPTLADDAPQAADSPTSSTAGPNGEIETIRERYEDGKVRVERQVMHSSEALRESRAGVPRRARRLRQRSPVALQPRSPFEDMGRAPDAVLAYEAALAGDPDLADGHYNLALLYERLAKPKDAIRHMARYRMLTGHRAK